MGYPLVVYFPVKKLAEYFRDSRVLRTASQGTDMTRLKGELLAFPILSKLLAFSLLCSKGICNSKPRTDARNEASQCPLHYKKIASRRRYPHPRPENRRIGEKHE
ncbi:hypothetical protein AXX17_ATUG02770 (mitochondrion) [Arabidopsis thaliana]|uniref:Uncharacterized protein n=1 Tax=Arabidopsis thaliana TaxID=3702 RepID=A0A178U6H7_ARATH|nr:hypothetical protein AXX17_ATUG02770 [Arabidopsis thaliana]